MGSDIQCMQTMCKPGVQQVTTMLNLLSNIKMQAYSQINHYITIEDHKDNWISLQT